MGDTNDFYIYLPIRLQSLFNKINDMPKLNEPTYILDEKIKIYEYSFEGVNFTIKQNNNE
ncbi:MAG: hypothetical protein LBM96_05900 [Methanobrevibacter sp.]|jgi:hypothetical protein|nr:hypothetical protein [Candidatus Methanoflexus mossambicus]